MIKLDIDFALNKDEHAVGGIAEVHENFAGRVGLVLEAHKDFIQKLLLELIMVLIVVIHALDEGEQWHLGDMVGCCLLHVSLLARLSSLYGVHGWRVCVWWWMRRHYRTRHTCHPLIA